MKSKGWVVFVLAIIFPVLILSNPSGADIVNGIEGISSNDTNMTIVQNEDRAIIDWQDFSIAAGEITNFIQPTIDSSVLNRVVGGDISTIYGTLSGNGSVIVVNPNGLIIGPGGIVDAGNFIASTLDVSNGEFLAGGEINFFGEVDGDIQNLGKITARNKNVFIIAREVDNDGEIIAENGEVKLVGGYSELLLTEKRNLVVKTVLEGSVSNSGTIEAVQAELDAAGGDIYGLAVSCDGVVNATSLEERQGRIILFAEIGKSAVSGGLVAHGGEIRVLGDEVEISGTIDVSGQGGGGSVLIGGDYQGSNPAIKNAQNTTVNKGALINADSTESGDAGNIVVWADGRTEHHGHITAQALGFSGDGGFVEVSGKQILCITDIVNLRSIHGDFGSLLLDPSYTGDVIITSGAVDAGVGNTLTDGYINGQLAAGDLTITTTYSDADAQGDIEFQSSVDIDWEEKTSFTCTATGNITINSKVSISNTYDGLGEHSAIVLTAGTYAARAEGNALSIAGSSSNKVTISSKVGDISLTGTGATGGGYGIDAEYLDLSTTTGNIVFTGAAKTDSNGVDFGNTTIKSTSGNVTVTGTSPEAYAVLFEDESYVDTAGVVTITGNGDAAAESDTGYGVVFKDSSYIKSGGNDISITGDVNSKNGSAIYITTGATAINSGGGDITLTATNTLSSALICDCSGIESGGGKVSLTGKVNLAKASSSETGSGIVINDESIINSSAGAIDIIGVSYLSEPGVKIVGGSSLDSSGGDIFMLGVSDQIGVNLYDIDLISSGTGNVKIVGVGNDSYGVLMQEGGKITSTTGSVTAIAADTYTYDSTDYTGSSKYGVELSSFGGIETGGGAITFTGAGTSLGVILLKTSITSGEGKVTFNGTATTGSGVLLEQEVSLTSTSGDIAFTGKSTDSYGIYLRDTVALTSTTGGVTFDGTTTKGRGVFLDNGVILTSTSGDISLIGDSTDSCGIYLSDSIALTSTSGDISLTGDSVNSYAIYLSETVALTSTGGNITFDGTATTERGVFLKKDVSVASTSGGISLKGTSTDSLGVELNDAITLTSTKGAITIQGTSDKYYGSYLSGGITTGDGFTGFVTTGDVTINSGEGALSITGTSKTADRIGLYCGGIVKLASTTGAINLTGRGDWCALCLSGSVDISSDSGAVKLYGNGARQYGIYCHDGVKVNSGMGTLTLEGISNNEHSAILVETNASLSSSSGDISLTGTTTDGYGVIIQDSATINSETGIINIDGTTKSTTVGRYGVYLKKTSLVTSGDADITVKGRTTNSSAAGIVVSTGTVTFGGSEYTGTIVLDSDLLDITGPLHFYGNLDIVPDAKTTAINLFAPAESFYLTKTSIENIESKGDGKVTIGIDEGAHTISIGDSGNYSLEYDLTLQGKDITVEKGFVGDVIFKIGQAGNGSLVMEEAVTGTAQIVGGSDDNTCEFKGNATLDLVNNKVQGMSFSNIDTISSSDGNVTITGPDSEIVEFEIIGSKTVKVDGITCENCNRINTTNGKGVVSATGDTLIWYAGEGYTKVLDVSLYDFSKFDAGTGTYSLQGPDENFDWALKLDGDDTYVSAGANVYYNFASLKGGSGVDTFKFKEGASFAGAIDGGSETNIFDYSEYGGAVEVDCTDMATGVSSYSNIGKFIGASSSATSNKITGPVANTAWTVSGHDSGRAGSIEFENFGFLQGNSGDDSFSLNSGYVEKIDGAEGSNAIDVTDYSDYNHWTITGSKAGTLHDGSYTTATAFTNISELVGGENQATVEADNGVDNVWKVDFININGWNIAFTNIEGANIWHGEVADISFKGVQKLIGCSDKENVLTGTAHNNTWKISGENSGKVHDFLEFENMSSLKGNEYKDTFKFYNGGSISGSINGGGGSNNVIEYGDCTQNVTADVSKFSNIYEILGCTTLTLQGPDAKTTWNITGEDEGNIGGAITFTDVKKFLGGSELDSFVFTADGVVTGEIDGGSGETSINGMSFYPTELFLEDGRIAQQDSGAVVVAESLNITNYILPTLKTIDLSSARVNALMKESLEQDIDVFMTGKPLPGMGDFVSLKEKRRLHGFICRILEK
jgi:filamentous hemagglutinin family protein